MADLVLSLFPGIGLLDMAFEEEGFCVVRRPDVLWGGDVRRFHLPARKFDGVIGGPPCQMWARTKSFQSGKALNLIPEFERVVHEAFPRWFLMENVPAAPLPTVPGFTVHDVEIADHWVGGATGRRRRFSFGSMQTCSSFFVETLALHTPNPHPAVIAGGATLRRDGTRYRDGRNYGAKTAWAFARGVEHQGLSPDFDLPPFTVKGKVAAIGNGVPLAMGRAVARAVRKVLEGVG